MTFERRAPASGDAPSRVVTWLREMLGEVIELALVLENVKV
jgi:hypothetical protein